MALHALFWLIVAVVAFDSMHVHVAFILHLHRAIADTVAIQERFRTKIPNDPPSFG
jgi:hypothetical protein